MLLVRILMTPPPRPWHKPPPRFIAQFALPVPPKLPENFKETSENDRTPLITGPRHPKATPTEMLSFPRSIVAPKSNRNIGGNKMKYWEMIHHMHASN